MMTGVFQVSVIFLACGAPSLSRHYVYIETYLIAHVCVRGSLTLYTHFWPLIHLSNQAWFTYRIPTGGQTICPSLLRPP